MALKNNPTLFVQVYGRGLRTLAPYQRAFINAMYEDPPHRVHYQAWWDPHVRYESPLAYVWKYGLLPSPSDCVWIVPGTLKDTSNL